MKCLSPISINSKKGRLNVRCGTCVNCIQGYIREWVFRLKIQNKYSLSSLFITLTYDDSNLVYDGDGEQVLYYRDVQLFLKKIRKAGYKDVKYYCVGERGDLYERTHWHMILFNADEFIVKKSWQNGFVDIKPLTDGRIIYTLKYMKKGDGRSKMCCSKGIGKDYLKPSTIKHHRKGYNVELRNGRYIMALPRYYRDKIWKTEFERAIVNQKLMQEGLKAEILTENYFYNQIKFDEFKRQKDEKNLLIKNYFKQ